MMIDLKQLRHSSLNDGMAAWLTFPQGHVGNHILLQFGSTMGTAVLQYAELLEMQHRDTAPNSRTIRIDKTIQQTILFLPLYNNRGTSAHSEKCNVFLMWETMERSRRGCDSLGALEEN